MRFNGQFFFWRRVRGLENAMGRGARALFFHRPGFRPISGIFISRAPILLKNDNKCSRNPSIFLFKKLPGSGR